MGYYIDVERLERAQVQRVESEHRAAEVKYRQLFDTNAAPILLLDQAGAILGANPAAQALGHGDVVGKPFSEIAGCADDGRGFDPAALERQPQDERLGLLGMRERVALLGGRLNVQSAPGEGTIIETMLSAAPR